MLHRWPEGSSSEAALVDSLCHVERLCQSVELVLACKHKKTSPNLSLPERRVSRTRV